MGRHKKDRFEKSSEWTTLLALVGAMLMVLSIAYSLPHPEALGAIGWIAFLFFETLRYGYAAGQRS